MEILADFRGSACIFAALLCLVLPLNWLGAAMMAAVFHEICHILAVRAAGGRINQLIITITGARMESSPMSPGRELLCILAGPAGSLSLILVSSVLPRVAFCGAVQGIFNLLPLHPLDGGRVLSCVAGMLFPSAVAHRFCLIVKWITLVMILCAGLWWSIVMDLGYLPVIISLLLISRSAGGKIPCIAAKIGVQ